MRPAPPEPSREEVAQILSDVVSGRLSREEASQWAHPWVAADDPGVKDRAVWDALKHIGGIDLRHGRDEPYLHPAEQIEEWRESLLSA